MGVLNRLFGSTEFKAKQIEQDDEAISRHWRDYVGTVPRKKKLIETLEPDHVLPKTVQGLQRLFKLELLDIQIEERNASDLISELEELEHEKKIKRVQRLEHCLAYAETKYEYVYTLLEHIYNILTTEAHIVTTLTSTSKQQQKLVFHLNSQLELELETISQIGKIQTFHNLFLALVKGQHIIQTMDARQKRLLRTMSAGMKKIFSKEIDSGVTYDWAITVYNQVQDLVEDHTALIGLGYDPHQDVDFEFVNSSKFVDLVRTSIKTIKDREFSERMITVFVHVFREWYNHERD